MDWSNNPISTILGRLQRCIGDIVSSMAWDHLTAEDTHTRNDLELLCVDAGLLDMDSKGTEDLADEETLRSFREWVDASIKLADSGKLNEVDCRKGQRLLESIQCGTALDREEVASLRYGSGDKPRLKRTQHVSTLLRDASRSLFRALVYSSCCCGNHIARIHLNGFDITEDEALEPRFVFFLSSGPDSRPCHWQEASFKIDAPAIQTSKQHHEMTLCLLLQECRILGEPLTMTLRRATDETPRIIGKRVSAACRQDLPNKSLGDLIDQDELINCRWGGKFPEASKAALCLNLSLALIHLSASEWVSHRWDIDNIFLACDSRQQNITTWDTDQPYLSRRLNIEASVEGHEVVFSPAKSRLLSFAQVVMEIYVGERFAKGASSKGERFQRLRKLIADDNVQRSVPKSVREAIQSCIDFVSQGEWDEQPDDDWIFTEIILKLDNTVRLYAPPPSRPRVIEARTSMKSQKRKSEGVGLESRCDEEPKRVRRSRGADWFQMFECVKEVLSDSIGDDHHPKAKVAILDTGLTAEAAAKFQQPESNYRDFTDQPKEVMTDSTGHGTSVFELVCRVCENADILVARVWEGSRGTATTVQSTIKALEWATKNDVDIICIASGFHSEPPELREALLKVFAANILVFAAASNHSNRMGVTYPARWDDLVFCMFSTNGDLKNSRSINPAGLGNDDFAIFGENIRLYSGQVDSGTSYATAVACGFAARLLDFSRQKDVVKARFGGFGDRIKQKRILTKVFRDISRQDEGYRCIVPWRLLPEELQGQFDGFTDEEIRDARERICIRISQCSGII